MTDGCWRSLVWGEGGESQTIISLLSTFIEIIKKVFNNVTQLETIAIAFSQAFIVQSGQI